MQLTDKDGNIFGTGGLEITTSSGKPKVPVINTDITIGVTSIVGGVAGRLLFDDAGVVGETNGAFWNVTNQRFGIGTTNPVLPLHVVGGTRLSYTTTSVVHGWGNTLLDLVGNNGTNPGVNEGRLHIGYNQNDPELRVNSGGVMVYTGKWTFIPQIWFAGGITSTHNTAITIDGMTNGVSSGTAGEIFRFTQRGGQFGSFYDAGSGLSEFRIWRQTDNTKYIYLKPGSTSIISSGSLLINTTVDSGYKLDVSGIIRSAGTNGLILSDGTYAAKTWMNSYIYTIEKEGSYGISTYQLKYNDTTDALYLSSTSIRGDATYGVVMSRSIYAPHNGAFGFLTYGSTTQYSAIKALYTDNNSSGIAFNYKTANVDTEAMRITSAGNVGIGTASPTNKLDISFIPNRLISFTQRPGYADYGRIVFSNVTGADIASSGNISLIPGDANEIISFGSFLTRSAFTASSNYGTYSPTGVGFQVHSNKPFVFRNISTDINTDFFVFEAPNTGARRLFNIIQNSVSYLTVFPTGNVTIGTTTDAGYKLDVNGNTRIQGNTTLTGTLTMGNGSFSYSANPNNWFTISGNQGLILNQANGNNGSIVLGASNSANFTVALTNTTMYGVSISRPVTPIAGSTNLTYNSLEIDNVINYTNATNSIVRGLYIHPTLTSVTDFRAIETTVGNVLFGTTSGNVGIGITSPANILDVRQSIGSDGTNIYSGFVSRIQNTKDYDNVNGVLLLVNQNGGTAGHYIRAINAQGSGQIRFGVDGGGNVSSIGSGSFSGNVRATQIRWNTDGDGWIGDGGLDGTFMVITNSTERYRVTPNGNLLINTTTDAGYKLDVNGNTRSNRFYANDGITLQRISFEGFNNVTGIDFNSTTGLFKFFASTSNFLSAGFNLDTIISPVRNTVDNLGDVVIQGGGSERARFKANGNVGIGTTTPTTLLDVNGTVKALYVNTPLIYGSGDLDLAAAGGTTGILIKNATRNVLINTTVDSGYKLDVNGSANVQSGLTVSGSLNLNSSDISSAWTTYTPTWSTDGATQPSLGNGTITGAYKVIGKTVFVRVRLVFGTTTTAGTGTFYFSLPVNAAAAWGVQMPVSLLDNGNAWYQATVNGEYGGFTDKVALITQSAGGANSSQGVTGVFPITFGSTDSIQFNGSYESI